MAAPVKLLAFGDSLTAGYGLPTESGFVTKLQAALRAEGLDVTVLNGGVSGDTTAGGRARLDWTLAEKPDFAILELGANDGLRGLDPKAAADNLDAMLALFAERKIPVLLTGMQAPPNFGRDYGEAFNGMYQRLATKHKVPLYPFFLDGVAADPSLNQADGIHPNPKGVDIVVARILPQVKSLIGQAQ